ncbi:BLUF domain-containing protein [Sphingorhabdus sp.]|uniref:BLUF domain-containing protein n=1 Tax=Sphingorhabdus sp. TaxID=1902408 RepID=UPI003983A454
MFDEPGFPNGADLEDGAPMLYTFVYCSRATEGVDDLEVDRIVEAAQRRNIARGITGVLVFGNGVFFQLLEGPAVEVQKLIANLHSDPRHCDVVSLDWSEERRERLYPNWEMERVEADDIRAVLNDALLSSEDQANVAALTRILKHLDLVSLD